MAERMRFNFITFCKRSKYISRRWHSFFRSSLLLLQRAYQTFPENRDRVVFLYLIFLIHTDLFSIFLIFFRKPKVTRRIPQLLLVVQEKESPFFVNFIFHFLFSFRWRLRNTQTSVTRWIDGTWSLCKQKYFSVSFFLFYIYILYLFIYLFEFPNVILKRL